MLVAIESFRLLLSLIKCFAQSETGYPITPHTEMSVPGFSNLRIRLTFKPKEVRGVADLPVLHPQVWFEFVVCGLCTALPLIPCIRSLNHTVRHVVSGQVGMFKAVLQLENIQDPRNVEYVTVHAAVVASQKAYALLVCPPRHAPSTFQSWLSSLAILCSSANNRLSSIPDQQRRCARFRRVLHGHPRRADAGAEEHARRAHGVCFGLVSSLALALCLSRRPRGT